MTLEASINWQDGLAFNACLDGFSFAIDSAEAGEKPRGPKPKGLILVSLAGCTGMDVISMLHKMRQKVSAFDIQASAEVAKEHPKKITSIHLIYHVTGSDLKPEAVKQAVELSQTKYCGVFATLAPGVAISSEIRLNGQACS